ncbi:hypothetical protein B0H17DRAFT_1065531 [Mycena rosella]|uniref:Secreted protein n=1 Tax=Mycena rosella TaxID=1033263 RepID=A0AAD7DFH8_MYCRO|nr:hypothetical protein B0H17DRAFT_1065531 [Mycena rosella]
MAETLRLAGSAFLIIVSVLPCCYEPRATVVHDIDVPTHPRTGAIFLSPHHLHFNPHPFQSDISPDFALSRISCQLGAFC